MRRLILKDVHNQEVIFPYIGGEEVNTSPTNIHRRYVINFGDRPEDECRQRWPDLMAIVEANVRPERLLSAQRSKSAHGLRAGIWWQHYHHARELYSAIAGMDRVLVVNCGATQHLGFVFLPARMVFANSLAVFAESTYAAFATLQARPHEIWARFFGSSLEDRLRYTPSDCFETFPFPLGWETRADLEIAGNAYYEFRAALMVSNNDGLTKTYNRFHDPDERMPEILKLRELHAAMDRSVLDAYGWNDISTDCEFLLDYEIDEAEWGSKKKPYRLRWPDEVGDEVLARLLELNADLAREEARSGAAAPSKRLGKVNTAHLIEEADTGRLFS